MGLDLSVAPGEVVILGPNGAGKTTALQMLATLLRPTSGDATVGGHSITSAPLGVRSCLGYLTGDTGLYGRLTPEELLRYFGELHGMAPDTLGLAIEREVQALGISPFGTDAAMRSQQARSSGSPSQRAFLHDLLC